MAFNEKPTAETLTQMVEIFYKWERRWTKVKVIAGSSIVANLLAVIGIILVLTQ